MARTVKLEVITPSKLFYKGEVELVIVRTLTGEEGFMAGHIWACKLLDVGPFWIQEAGSTTFRAAALAGGYIDVKDSIIIYTDAAEWAEDIDMERAKTQKEAAQAFLDARQKVDIGEDPDVDRARVNLAKAMTRMRLAEGGGERKR